MASATQQLASRAMAIGTAQLPSRVVDQAKACLVYGLTMACAGNSDEPVWRTLSAGAPHGLLAAGGGRSVSQAAAANAALFASRGQNDSHGRLSGHVGCVALPALLAVAEAEERSGDALIRGIVAAYEIAIAAADGFADNLREKGMRTTSWFGPAATAAGIAILRGQSGDMIENAIALGFDAGSGSIQCWSDGSDDWRWQAGRSAAAGIVAADLAVAGARGSANILDGTSGLYQCFGTTPHNGGTAPAWLITETEFKPFPGCFINQLPAAALATLMSEAGVSATDVERLIVMMNIRDASYPGVSDHGPFSSEAAAIMSAPFMLAGTLRDGQPAARHFRDEYGIGDLHDLGARISIEVSSTIDRYGATLDLTLKDGCQLRSETKPAAFQGMSFDRTIALITPAVEDWPWPDRTTRFHDLCTAVAELPAGDMARLLRPSR
nr:MmgE/PrpD family protein [Sphingomonas sp. Y57]